MARRRRKPSLPREIEKLTADLLAASRIRKMGGYRCRVDLDEAGLRITICKQRGNAWKRHRIVAALVSIARLAREIYGFFNCTRARGGIYGARDTIRSLATAWSVT